MDGCEEEDGQVMVVGLRPASLTDEVDVCYTELKPSTTLLVPIELAAEHQELLQRVELPEVTLPVGSNNFSLMLEADDEEPAALEMDPENVLTLKGNTEHAGDLEEEPNVVHDVQEPEEMFKIEEMPSETVVPDVVEPNKPVEKVKEQEMTKLEPNTELQTDEPAGEVQTPSNSEAVATPEPLKEDESDEPADEVQAEQTDEKRPDFEPEDEAQTAQESKEKPLESAEEPVKEHMTIEAFDEIDVCVSNQLEDPGLTAVMEDGFTHNEKIPDEIITEACEMVPVAEECVSDAYEAEQKDTKLKEAIEATAKLKEVHQSPARRGRMTVTCPVTMMESEKEASEEDQSESNLPYTPRRVTRSSKQLVVEPEVLITPRRSTRKTDSEVMVEKVPSTKATPSRKTPQKATPRRGSRSTRISGATDVQKMEENSIVEHPSARKTRKVGATVGVPEPIPEENSVEHQANVNASPSRVTRQSSRRLSLTLESFHMVSDVQNTALVTPPRSRRKARSTTEDKPNNETYVVDGAQLQNVSRRLTRSRHWNNGEELEKPENLESTNLLENALLERLNNEAKECEVITEIVRAKRRPRSVAPSVEREDQSAEAQESLLSTEQQQKKSAPSVRRTRASRAPKAETSPVSDITSGAESARGSCPISECWKLTLCYMFVKCVFLVQER